MVYFLVVRRVYMLSFYLLKSQANYSNSPDKIVTVFYQMDNIGIYRLDIKSRLDGFFSIFARTVSVKIRLPAPQ